MAGKQGRSKVSDILVERKAVDADALKTAQQEASSSGIALEKYLVENDVVPAAEMTLAVSEYLNIQPINLAHFVPDAELVDMISWEALKRHQAVPIAKTGRNLTVALGDPF
ncbi:MAG: hypothetical protein R6V03_08705, partial [Kiritimatiellia bacterium]